MYKTMLLCLQYVISNKMFSYNLDFCLKVMKYVGVSPKRRTRLQLLLVVFSLFVNFSCGMLALLLFVYNEEPLGVALVTGILENLVLVMHVSILHIHNEGRYTIFAEGGAIRKFDFSV